ncbi:MAG TPA: alkane 1-monooxygenase [Candidatus Lokiarchaeia archaeon]|nr:alkane 1-monooxygenase [Candidatus Lokiarchaeia archaeon]
MKAAPFTLVFLVPFSVVIGTVLGGWFNLLTPFSVFIAVPLVDLVVGAYTANPVAMEEPSLERQKSFRIITWACVPVTIGLIMWGMFRVAARSATMAWWEMLLFMFSTGVSTGIVGINVSHELQHRVNNKFEPALARLLLLFTLYMHWAIEHLIGHHRWVATPVDPATAPRGQSIYRFWWRTVFGGLKSAWKIEQVRITRLKRYRLAFLRNRVLGYFLLEMALIASIWYFLGIITLGYFIGQSIVAISLLEVINYIEHYGLLRHRLADGTYEPVKPVHSWNSSNRVTNYFLFNLQRHSDHHFKPGRRYQLLRHFDESPQLPTGYGGMVVLALVPPLYKHVMEKRIPQEMKRESEGSRFPGSSHGKI